ncbi:hypothetical protein [Janthinobacterium violaceinigrum]|uniref:hypothetical protein n=1 Tax=Janthinobacterium violaceinigrum TaxID=2654252 RepID=UPI001D00693B|nr:hypothetical protein [Janthinobacterium violaceinigrum]
MLAWKLTAGAGAFEGGFAQVDLGAVGILSASLAFAPDGGLRAAQLIPFGGEGQLATCLGGTGIGCQGENLIGIQEHEANLQVNCQMIRVMYLIMNEVLYG